MKKAKSNAFVRLTSVFTYVMAVILTLSAVIPAHANITRARAVRIHSVEGEVTTSRENLATIRTRPNQRLSPGHTVNTSVDSTAHFEADGTRFLRMDEMSRVVVETATREQIQLLVEEGNALVEVATMGENEHFTGRVGSISLGVRGTTFIVGHDLEGNAQIVMLEGLGEAFGGVITVIGADGQEIETTMLYPGFVLTEAPPDADGTERSRISPMRFETMNLFTLQTISDNSEMLLASGVLTEETAASLPGYIETATVARDQAVTAYLAAQPEIPTVVRTINWPRNGAGSIGGGRPPRPRPPGGNGGGAGGGGGVTPPAPSPTPAPPTGAVTYHAGDIAAINRIIAENGLPWTPVTVPAGATYVTTRPDWPEDDLGDDEIEFFIEGVYWDEEANPRRIVAFEYANMNLDLPGAPATVHRIFGNLDLTALTALEGVTVGGNNLDSIDVSANFALVNLNAFDNNLTSIDVSNNPALEWIAVWDNNLTSIDVSNNTALEFLAVTGNQMPDPEAVIGLVPGAELVFEPQRPALVMFGENLQVLATSPAALEIE